MFKFLKVFDAGDIIVGKLLDSKAKIKNGKNLY